MARYRLSNLEAWIGRQVDLADPGDWLDLLDDFGPSLLRFLLDETYVSQIPDSDSALREFRRSVEKTPLSSLKPERGAVWVLFAYKGRWTGLPAPFRKHGVMLPFGWEKSDGTEDESMVPQPLCDLAEKVKEQLGCADESWRLTVPKYFGGDVDLRLAGATYDSAWGALASGLYLALNPQVGMVDWPFSSVAFDFKRKEPKAVGELEAKIGVVASMRAEELAVAPVQATEALRRLRDLRVAAPDDRDLRRLKIFAWEWNGNLTDSLGKLVGCNQHNTRRRRLVGWMCNLAVVALALGLGWLYCDDCTRVKKLYFADYAEYRGSLVGVFPVAKDNRPALAYEFSYRGYDSPNPLNRKPVLREVWCVNAKGERQTDVSDRPEHRRVAGRLFFYENRQLSSISFCDRQGRVLDVFKRSGKNREVVDVVTIDSNEVIRAASLSFQAMKMPEGVIVRRMKYEWDERGFLKRLLPQSGLSGRAAESCSGSAGIGFETDDAGRVVSVTYQTLSGDKAVDSRGVHRKTFAYTGVDLNVREKYSLENRLLERMEYVQGKRRKLTVFCENGSYDVHDYDEQGRCCRVEYRSATGDLEADGTGVASVRYSYDAEGRKREFLYDSKGSLISKESR